MPTEHSTVYASADRATHPLLEIPRYRNLLYFLAWRDVKVRYKQTLLGGAWALIQPLVTMILFSVIFGHFARMPSDGVPYPMFALAALVPWYYFANGVTQSSNSLVANSNLISKVYFPRLILPLAALLPGLLDLTLAFGLVLGVMLYFGVIPSLALFFIPFLVILALTTALGISLWLSALNVRFRDVAHAVPFLLQVWLYASPVAYPTSLFPEAWRLAYAINPMVGVIEGFRWALLRNGPPPVELLAISTLAASLVLVSGFVYFRRAERTFADVV